MSQTLQIWDMIIRSHTIQSLFFHKLLILGSSSILQTHPYHLLCTMIRTTTSVWWPATVLGIARQPKFISGLVIKPHACMLYGICTLICDYYFFFCTSCFLNSSLWNFYWERCVKYYLGKSSRQTQNLLPSFTAWIGVCPRENQAREINSKSLKI